MPSTVPSPVAAALGIVPTVLSGVRRLPGKAISLPITAISISLATLERSRQEYDALAERGERLLARLRGASFDELEDRVEDSLQGTPLAAPYDALEDALEDAAENVTALVRSAPDAVRKAPARARKAAGTATASTGRALDRAADSVEDLSAAAAGTTADAADGAADAVASAAGTAQEAVSSATDAARDAGQTATGAAASAVGSAADATQDVAGATADTARSAADAVAGGAEAAADAAQDAAGTAADVAQDAAGTAADVAQDAAGAAVDAGARTADAAADEVPEDEAPKGRPTPKATEPDSTRIDTAAASDVVETVERVSAAVGGAVVEHDELPLPDYDHMTLGSLRGRMRSLDVPQLIQIRDYEKAHANRLPIVTMLDNRIAKLATDPSAPLSGGSPLAKDAAKPKPTKKGSMVTPATGGPALNPPSQGVPTNPAQPRTTGSPGTNPNSEA